MGTEIFITILALLFSAAFSAYEIAFFSSNKLKIELDRKQGKKYALVMNRFIQHPEELISCLLMGNNVAIVIYGISIAKILNPIIEQHITTLLGAILAIETFIATIIVLVTAEFLPKALSRLNPNGLFSSLYWLILFFYYILYPLTYITNIISKWMIGRWPGFKGAKEVKGTLFDKSDLMHLSNEVSGAQEQENEHMHDILIFQNALNFSSVKLKECMVPRTEIAAIDMEDNIEELTKLFVESGFSRLMVYRDNIDNIIGYIHSKDLFKSDKKTVSELLRSVNYVPQEMSAQALLAFFTKNRKSVAVVRDEYGGTGGI
ncbi:MAG: hemolysin family protein, partial [Bacteroidales bacterium]